MNFWKKGTVALVASALAATLWGCTEVAQQAPSVTYRLLGKTVYSHTQQPEQPADAYGLTLKGAQFMGWLDAEGRPVGADAVQAGGVYDAWVRPLLTGSGVYMQLQEGLFLPDAPLTHNALSLL